MAEIRMRALGLDQESYDTLKEMAKQEERSMSSMVRRTIKAYKK